MKDKLRKLNNGTYSLYDCDGDIIASSDPKKPTSKKLSVKNCEDIENGYDLDKLALQSFHVTEIKQCHNNNFFEREEKFKQGFQKALEILGDKKFDMNDIALAFRAGIEHGLNPKKLNTTEYVQSLKQTEWDVEFEMQEVITDVALDIPGFVYKNYFKPRLDKDGCLILKRI